MSKVTLSNVGSLQDTTTAATTLNKNFTTISTAFDNTLSLDGTSPNQMKSNLDMNGSQILNLPSPATVNSPARLIDVTGTPTLQIPPVGTSGGTVPLLNANNTFSGNDTFSGNNSFSGTNTFSGSTSMNTLSVSGGLTLGGTTSVAALNVSGNMAASGTNSFSGVNTFTANTFMNNGAFYAHNNGVNITFTPPNPNNYAIFAPTAVHFNHGNYWSNAGLHCFTPPTGAKIVRLDSAIWVRSGANLTGFWVAKWIKNYSLTGGLFQTPGTGTELNAALGSISVGDGFGSNTIRLGGGAYDACSPGDYYGLFLYVDSLVQGTTAVVIDGNESHSYISGAVVG